MSSRDKVRALLGELLAMVGEEEAPAAAPSPAVVPLTPLPAPTPPPVAPAPQAQPTTNVPTRVCPACHKPLPLDAFRGPHGACRACAAMRVAEARGGYKGGPRSHRRKYGVEEPATDVLPTVPPATISVEPSPFSGKARIAAEASAHATASTTDEHAGAPEETPADRAVRETAAKRREKQLRSEHADLVQRLLAAEERQRVWDRISAPHTPTLHPTEPTSGQREGALVVLASDWHVEETVEAEKVAGVNAYNLDIAQRRIRRFFAGIRWLLQYHRQAFAMRHLVLALMGDIITGYIHRELLETNSLSPVQALVWVRAEIADGVASLLADPELTDLVIVWSNGNHDRTTEKRQIKTGAENSYGWLLGMWLADQFKDEPRITFVIDRSAHQYVEIYGYTLHFTHGDELKYQGGVGGIGIPLLKRVPMWDRLRSCAYHHLGHFHQLRDYGRAVVNGSLIGTTEYSVGIGADLEPPQQASYVLDSRRGKTLVAPLWVDEEDQR